MQLVLGSGKAHSVLANVELCVVDANEDVAENPKRKFNPEKTTKAECLSHLGNL